MTEEDLKKLYNLLADKTDKQTTEGLEKRIDNCYDVFKSYVTLPQFDKRNEDVDETFLRLFNNKADKIWVVESIQVNSNIIRMLEETVESNKLRIHSNIENINRINKKLEADIQKCTLQTDFNVVVEDLANLCRLERINSLESKLWPILEENGKMLSSHQISIQDHSRNFLRIDERFEIKADK